MLSDIVGPVYRELFLHLGSLTLRSRLCYAMMVGMMLGYHIANRLIAGRVPHGEALYCIVLACWVSVLLLVVFWIMISCYTTPDAR